MTFDPDLLSDLRGDLGDTDTPPQISDPDLERFYNKAVALGENEDTTYAITMVYGLRRLLGLARKLHDARGEVEVESFGQVFDHIKDELLPYWERVAGMTGAVLSTGMLGLDLDYTQEDFDAEFGTG